MPEPKILAFFYIKHFYISEISIIFISSKSNKMTTKDFSDQTLKLYNEVKVGDRATSDLIDVLIDSDFDKHEIHQFIKKEFKIQYKGYLKRYIDWH